MKVCSKPSLKRRSTVGTDTLSAADQGCSGTTAGLLGLEIPDSAPQCEERRFFPTGLVQWVLLSIGPTGQRLDVALDPLEHDRLPVGGRHVLARLTAPLDGRVATRFRGRLLLWHWILFSRTEARIALAADRDRDSGHIAGADRAAAIPGAGIT